MIFFMRTVLTLISIPLLFADSIDPAIQKIQYNDTERSKQEIFRRRQDCIPLIPPELDLSLSLGQDTVYVSFTSNQPLCIGWLDTSFCSAYPNWDYWWLNTRFGIDGLDTVYVLVSLYNYSNTNYNFHRDVLDYTGNVVYQDAEWNGYQMQPIVRDGRGDNHYIGHPVLGWFDNMDAGAVDRFNYIYSSKADSSNDILFTKLDSIGNIVLNQIPVATGDTAQGWIGDSHIALNSQGYIYLTWSRNMHEIVFSKSTDGGISWALPVTIARDFANQVNKPEVLISRDDHIHFIWQHWTGSHNCLVYKKLYPNDSCCVDTTNLTPDFLSEVWAPEFAIDADTNIHIVWSLAPQGSNLLYYTLINGRLDKGGAPASDNEITIVQEYAFYNNNEPKRYPKIAIDSLACPHVIFDQGTYGSGNTKTVYHMKMIYQPQGYAIFPDSSIYELTINTSGGYTSFFPAELPGRYFVRVWGWNINGEVGWDTASITLPGIVENSERKITRTNVKLLPTISREKIGLTIYLNETQDINISLYDITGKKLNKEWQYNLPEGKNYRAIDLKGLPAGIYFVKIKDCRNTHLEKFVIID